MVVRHFLRCNICKQLLIVKEEKSNNKKPMSFIFYCGRCFSHFNAICDSSGIIFEGLHDTIEELYLEPEEAHKLTESAYVFEISGDYPVKKPRYMEDQSKMELDIVSPYMRMFPELTDFERTWIGNYIVDDDNYYFYESYWDQNRNREYDGNMIELIKSKKPDIVESIKLVLSSGFAPKTNLPDSDNAIVANFLMYTEIHDMFWFDKEVDEMIKEVTIYINNCFKDQECNEFKSFVKFIKNDDLFKSYIYRDDKVMQSIHNNRMKFLPVLMLDRHKDKESTVSTFSIDELLDFYASNYELILSNLDLAIFIENYSKRKSADKFLDSVMTVKKNQIYLNNRLMSKGQKVEFIRNKFCKSSLGKSYGVGWADNSIRNGIYHRDFKFNPITQVISFSKDKEYSLIDFANINLLLIKSALVAHQIIWIMRGIIGE